MQWKVKEKGKRRVQQNAIHPIVAALLAQRGIVSNEDIKRFFAPNYESDLHDPFLFRDMDRAVSRIRDAIERGEGIGIFGDHDADGVSSATLLADALETLGATVTVYIPDKVTEGHGINSDAIDLFAHAGITLMISVDCGTSSHEAVHHARAKGIDVIITDHHHAPDELPQAYAIINPQIASETYPFRGLSGTAVAFKLAHALFARLAPDRMAQLKWYLDIVCVGTIADCVPLVGENRVLVTYGLIVLGKTRRVGYRQLCVVGNFCADMGEIRADTVAYHIAPRINAAGRMRHAQHAYDLLRESRIEHAYEKALMIEDLNQQRKKITDEITRQVEQIVEAHHRDRACIIVAHEDYPAGIIGIVAGRIAEKYRKPTGIFTKFDAESRGSFRSVEGVHIVDVLRACSEHIVKYGGHEKAAGATVSHDAFDHFVEKIDEYVAQTYERKNEQQQSVDLEIALSDVTVETVEAIAQMEPFGEGNPEPLFMIRDVVVADLRAVGATGAHIKMIVTDKSRKQRIDVIGFYMQKQCEGLESGMMVDIVATMQKNVWQGTVRVQLRLVDIMKK